MAGRKGPYEIQIRGLDKLEAKYAKLGKDLYPEMAKETDRQAKFVLSKIPRYPPQGANVTGYQRTGTLGRKWTSSVERVGATAVGKIGIALWYAPWVVSEEQGTNRAGPQAWFHKGRWWTIQQVVKDVTPQVVKNFRKWVRRMLRSR